jgi:hypothetical protein
MSQLSGEIRKAFAIWFVANILGLGVPPLVLFLFPHFTAVSGLFSTTLIISLPLSTAQWAALRRVLPISILWIFMIPASILAMVLFIREVPERYFDLIDPESLAVLTATSFVIGLIIGLPQWLILRRECSGSSIWLLGSGLGIGLGAFIVIATDLVNQDGFLAYSIGALVYIITTGATLSWLISRRDAPETLIPSTA